MYCPNILRQGVWTVEHLGFNPSSLFSTCMCLFAVALTFVQQMLDNVFYSVPLFCTSLPLIYFSVLFHVPFFTVSVSSSYSPSPFFHDHLCVSFASPCLDHTPMTLCNFIRLYLYVGIICLCQHLHRYPFSHKWTCKCRKIFSINYSIHSWVLNGPYFTW